jgi:hypothetical protein
VLVSMAKADPQAFDTRLGGGFSRSIEEGTPSQLQHLHPPGMIYLDEENAILNVEEPAVPGEGIPRDLRPLLEQRRVGVLRKPPLVPEILS